MNPNDPLQKAARLIKNMLLAFTECLRPPTDPTVGLNKLLDICDNAPRATAAEEAASDEDTMIGKQVLKLNDAFAESIRKARADGKTDAEIAMLTLLVIKDMAEETHRRTCPYCQMIDFLKKTCSTIGRAIPPMLVLESITGREFRAHAASNGEAYGEVIDVLTRYVQAEKTKGRTDDWIVSTIAAGTWVKNLPNAGVKVSDAWFKDFQRPPNNELN